MSDESNNINPKYDALKYSYEQFDKNVLFIASGALGISFAFIEKLIPDFKDAISSCLLITSWYFFAGVIFISLITHFISIRAITLAIQHHNDADYEKISNRWNRAIRIINLATIIGLLLGILLLVHFVNLNSFKK